MDGVGIDVTSVGRVTGLLERAPRFADRVYTPDERRDCGGRRQRWASRWAAKEAVRKLFGSAGLRIPAYRAVEVVRRPGGAPSLRVDGVDSDLQLSLSDEGDLVVAVVIGNPSGAHLDVPAEMRLPERPDTAHKGTFGNVVVVGGALGYSGAPVMSASAAARAGAGRVSVCVPEPIYTAVAAHTLEVMAHPLPSVDGGIAESALETLRDKQFDAADALVIGPGLGRAAETERLLLALLAELPTPAVVDADGLNIAAAHGFDWTRCHQPVVLTPHPAEMGRLCSLSTQDVQKQRTQLAARYAREQRVVVTLKGSETVIAAPDGRLHVSAAKVVALASAGSGDVLSGVIAALLAAGLDGYDASVAAVAVHAEAGLALQRREGRAGVLSSDLLAELPRAQERLRRVIERRAATG